ncbi:GDSL esterase/lipase At1g71250 isoform X2 [Cannabis sativa]|uniref:GDSL esterase/lipase At1g71250 isoform X2 n=1 Tax=Cannabis sativa TaxID=3483 RepID=UPI0029CA1B17|nr:GDSL esterase/lipase At1g71250 isoform X2 [Cannabis sativa]
MALSLSSSSILILFLITISLFPYSSKCNNNNNFDDKNKNKMLIMKGMFVFGSSLVDNGNNNFINNSLAKANYLPYGLDFPLGPSGRFTNGKNVIDLIGEKLRLPFIPAFADPSTKGRRIVHGVSFASGGSGILDDTGSIAKLYRLGGRKFVLMSINPIGCSPMVRTMVQHSTPTQNRNRNQNQNQNRCIQGLNIAAQLFNNHLKSLVDTMKPQMPGSALLYVNSYKIIRDIIRNPFQKGFKEASKPCCKVATLSEGGNGVLCKREGSVCGNRSNHVFFDGLHPTEAVNIQIANKAFASTLPTEVYPINIQQLLQLQTTY